MGKMVRPVNCLSMKLCPLNRSKTVWNIMMVNKAFYKSLNDVFGRASRYKKVNPYSE